MKTNTVFSLIALALIVPTGAHWIDYGKKWQLWGKNTVSQKKFNEHKRDVYSKYFDDTDDLDDTEQYFGPLSVTKKNYKKNLIINGPANLKKVTFDKNLTVRGPLDAHELTGHDVTVYGPASINSGTLNSIITRGPLDITQVTAQALEVNGPLAASKSTISKTARVNGPVSLDESTFEKLIIQSSRVSVSSSTVDSVSITSHKKIPELYLDDATVKNVIVFIGRRGKVYLSGTSTKINKKQIQNGDIQETKNSRDNIVEAVVGRKNSENKTNKKQAANTVIIDGKSIELKDGQTITFKNGVMSIA